MTRVLIPFADPESGRCAIAQLLAETRDPQLRVHLLAAVETRRSGKVPLFLSRERAQAAVRDAGERWLASLAAVLVAEGIPVTTEVVVGPLQATMQATMHATSLRADVDRVLLPAARHCRQPLRAADGRTPVSPRRITLVG